VGGAADLALCTITGVKQNGWIGHQKEMALAGIVNWRESYCADLTAQCALR